MIRRLGRLRDPWLLALAGLLLATFVLLAYLGRGTVFQYDDWDYWQMSQSYAPASLLDHYNGQLSVVPKLVWFTTTHLFGGGEYAPFRIGGVLMHLVTLAGIFAVLRPRVGPAVALAALLPLALVGGASLTLLMANTYHYFGLPVLWLVWSIVALDRGTRGGDIVACVLLVLSVLTSSMGLTPIAAVTAYLLWREPQWRRLWIVAVPVLVFVVWFALERPEQRDEVTFGDVLRVPIYIAEGAATGLARYLSLSPFAATLSMAAIGLWVWAIAVFGRRLDRGAVALAAGAATFWALISIGRGPETMPFSPQYLFPDIALAAMAVVLLATGAAALLTRRAGLVALVLGAAFALPSAQMYADEARPDRAEGEAIRAGISAVNLLAEDDPAAAQAIDPPLTVRRDIDYEGDVYVRRLAEGREPIGVAPSAIASQPESFRAEVDRFLAQGIGARQEGAVDVSDARGPAPQPAASEGTVTADGSCLAVSPQGPFASVTVPAQTPLIVAPAGDEAADVRLLRFATTPLPTIDPYASIEGRPARFATRPVQGGGWTMNVASTAAFRVCSA